MREKKIYGLVVRHNYGHSFYASPVFTGDRNTVLNQTVVDDYDDEECIFLCLPDDVNSFRLERADGSLTEFITNKTSVQISPEMLSWNRKASADDKDDYGDTFAHFLVSKSNYLEEDERKEIPFHLFSRDILLAKESRGKSVALLMAEAGVFPPEAGELIDLDPNILRYLIYCNKHLGKVFFDEVLTKERLMHSYQDEESNFILISAAFLQRVLPDAYKYDTDILTYVAKFDPNKPPCPVLQAFLENDPGYIRGFPMNLLTVELMGARDADGNEIVLEVQGETKPLRVTFAEADKFPEDESVAIVWLLLNEYDDEKIHAAEIFFQLEYPDTYKQYIQSIRDNYRENRSSGLMDIEIL
ncbi:hypothetical protein [Aminivibrio sp.]|uniref:hypothetical protein n=1 Tax=Aminivibrio sp. TaxID=1872489 RepID=UPI001A4A7DA1|nr:hypothetical protein [Aminivibrio sp.]MBL3539226.1 hypothetical protein [Aminivibrio sp.]